MLAGCIAEEAGPESESVAEQAATTAFANDQAAFDFFVGKGLTDFQAAGIVGNLDQESGVDPTIAQYGGGPGRGIAQWSVGGRWDTSANDNVLDFAAQKGEGAKTLNLQLEFIWYELNNFGYGFSALKATTNVTDATIAFMDKYEICGTCASSQRVTYAKAVLAAYGGARDWAAKYVDQSWPLASMPPLQIHCGETVQASLKLKNTGSKAWNTSTKLGTTMPRDRMSMFADASWPAANRAAVSAAVAAGADGTFTFTFHGPTGAACVPGQYHEHFGLVQENVAWFSDSGEGGPADDQIEAFIELMPGDSSTGSGSSDGGSGDATGGCSTGGSGSGFVMLLALCGLRRRLPRHPDRPR